METVTGLEIVDRRLDQRAIESIVADAGKVEKAVDLSKVKGDSNQHTACIAVIAFKPTKVRIEDKEYISIYLSDLRNAQTTARLLVDRTVFGVIMAAVKPPASVEGLLILIVLPTVSIDINNGGQLTFNLERQNQIAVVGRSRYFARCGATKKNVGPDGMETFCKIPIDSSICSRCSYHAKTEDTHVGAKRALPDPLAVVTENKVTNYMFKSTTNANSAILNRDRDSELNEQDDGDVAFALRHNAAAVNNLLGAAYNTNNGASSTSIVLNRADPIELRTAQKIIQTLSTLPTNSTTNTTALPLHQVGGRIPDKVVSALSQRGDRIAAARSGNQQTTATITAHAQAYNTGSTSASVTNNSYSAPPTQASMAANSSTRNAYLQSQYNNSTTYNTNTSNTNTTRTTGAYKLVGDTIINASNLARNVANITAPTTTRPASANTAGVFHQLLSQTSTTNSTKPTPSPQHTQSAKANPVPYQHTVYSQNTNTSNTSRATTTSTTPHSTTATTHPKPTTTKPTLTPAKSALEAEIDLLLGRTSSHTAEAEADWAEGFDRRMDVLAKREFAQTKAAEVQSIDVAAYKCQQCEGRLTQEFPALCQQNLHTIHKVAAVKRFFECGQCGKREHSLSARKDLATKVILPPEIRCITCGAFRWRACGARGSGPLSVSVRDTIGGENRGIEGSKLIVSASEWTKRGDSVSMAERVSNIL